MKWVLSVLKYTVCITLGVILGEVGFNFINMVSLNASEWIQLIASISAVLAFCGLVVQIRIQNFQSKADKRPHFSAIFLNWVKDGDVAVSESNSWDFSKYTKGMISVSSIGDVTAIDLFLVATYANGDKDYLYLTKLEHEPRPLDFKQGKNFSKLEIYFKTSVEEFGRATFTFKKYIVVTPKYAWGSKLEKEYNEVVDATNHCRLEAKSSFSTYSFDEGDLKSAEMFNEELLKQNAVRDEKTEAINEYGRLQELSEHLLEPHLFPEDL